MVLWALLSVAMPSRQSRFFTKEKKRGHEKNLDLPKKNLATKKNAKITQKAQKNNVEREIYCSSTL
jgi:hypothetical protein